MVFTTPTIQNEYDKWNLKVTVTIDSGSTNVMNSTFNNSVPSNASIAIPLTLKIDIVELDIRKTINVSIEEYSYNNFSYEIESISNVSLWWPNLWGQQKLYTLKVTLQGENDDPDTKDISIGFREIKLIQDPLPGGKSFYFQVNGEAVPIRGSNWVPIDSFYGDNSRVNYTTYKHRLSTLKQGNQNMIRVWGGGVFEPDYFYQLADEYGIMIWHDMIFAGSNYWINPYYLESIKKEIHDTIHRLQYHPSIAIWVGNNENGPFCKDNPSAYSTLYFNSVLDIINDLDGSRDTISSSPCFGNETESDPCSNYDNLFYGDYHYYNYKNDCWNISLSIRARFLSEFGYQSFPSYSIMRQYLTPDQQYFNSDMMVNRDHHSGGHQDMINMTIQHFNLPFNYSLSNDAFKYMLYLTQVYHAYCFKVDVEYFRSTRNDCTENVTGCNMGTMYWQTADIWPGGSPAGMDWNGNYKLSQYYARKFYERRIIVGFMNGTEFSFWAINDDVKFECNSCDLTFTVYNYQDPKLMYTWNVSYDMKIASAIPVYSIFQTEFLKKTGNVCDGTLNNCILKWTAYDETRDNVVSRNWMFISSPKDIKTIDPELKIVKVEKDGNKEQEYIVTVSCKNLAVIVWLELSPGLYGYFSDNGFILHNEEINVTFHSRHNETTIIDVSQGISIWSLYDSGAFSNTTSY